MDFILSVIQNIPVLKNFVSKEKRQLYSPTRTGLECIAPLFQTVQETPQPTSTQITGTIPVWIKGNLLRNGPGKFEFGNESYNHWFDGMALMHKFTIENGCVTYMSRFLESNSYTINKSHNRIVVSEFGTSAMPDPCKSMFQRFLSTFELPEPTDNGNINFLKYNSDYYVSTETNVIHKVDPETLETRKKVDWGNYIAVNSATAHPHYEQDGTAYNMGNSYGKMGTCYNIIKVPAQESEADDTLHGASVVCSIPAKDNMKPSYYHSFGMTENYIVFIEQPLKLNILKILTSKISGASILDSFIWDPRYETIFHVVNKHTGEINPVTFHAQPFATFHQINAFEDQGCIVLDICCYASGEPFSAYKLLNLRQSGHALDEIYNELPKLYPWRFVFPLNIDPNMSHDVDMNPLTYTTATVIKKVDGKVWCTHENLYDNTLDDVGGLEFPSISYYKYNTKKYRYFYGCGFRHFVGTSLIKMDIDTKKLMVWQEDGFYPSEPVFIPCPDSNKEDDGVILSVVVTPHQDKKTFLLVLDAKNFTEIGRAEVPVHVPYLLHGIFVPRKH
ncbi:carotenoid-cleaving dioxygenase, mitochondrial-like [Spea bombifrons]|uniref:carotenoid-cleaving dioxygenase, mitochondrial-like n=1 Tax=Spea bombifrons TaxID=233779 RepID=UPI00234B8B21|nr:carotenoid-cleaving dioxygenase, mitochondrial-like [Spea bombifrons]